MTTPLGYATALLTLSSVLTVLLTTITIQSQPKACFPESSKNSAKEIVAYSLKKRLELDSKEVECPSGVGVELEFKEEGVEEDQIPDDYGFKKSNWKKVNNAPFYVYGVYEDNRLAPHRYVRILGMAKGKWNQTLYCQIPAPNSSYHLMTASATTIWSATWNQGNENTFNPILLSCYIPKLPLPPNKLYLNTDPCKISSKNSLTIWKSSKELFPKHDEDHDITVCVKPLSFLEDVSKDLVEWIEINRILGATKFYIHVKSVHKNMLKVLRFYQKQKNFEVAWYGSVQDSFQRNSKLSWKKRKRKTKKDSAVWEKRRNELISYNDCLYRNLASSFVLPIDIDEIIVPRKLVHQTWQQVLSQLKTAQNYGSISVRNAYFFKKFSNKVDDEAFFLRNTIRTTQFSDKEVSGKSFVSTRNTLTVFNHYALETLESSGMPRIYFFPPDVMQMNHYKTTCDTELLPECEKYFRRSAGVGRVNDTIMTPYKDKFEKAYDKVIEQIKKQM